VLKSRYKRILLKLSGQALGISGNATDKSGGFSISTVKKIVGQIKDVHELGAQIGIVIGGGNIFRGADLLSMGISRNSADTIGMLSTVMNAVFLSDLLKQAGLETVVMSQNRFDRTADFYTSAKAVEHLEKSRIVLYAGGLGMPYFSTDTAAAHRAVDTGCSLLIKGTKVDGIFDSDPEKNPDALKIDKLDYNRIILNNLNVMDLSAILLCRDNKLDLCVLDIFKENSLINAVTGKKQGTLVKG
jgi:uridylate kinase